MYSYPVFANHPTPHYMTGYILIVARHVMRDRMARKDGTNQGIVMIISKLPIYDILADLYGTSR